MNAFNDAIVTMPARPGLSANALRVLEARYLRRDRQRHAIETSEQLFIRVAKAVAKVERLMDNSGEFSFWREEFHQMLGSLDFLPNSPTLMNAGTPLGFLFLALAAQGRPGEFDRRQQVFTGVLELSAGEQSLYHEHASRCDPQECRV